VPGAVVAEGGIVTKPSAQAAQKETTLAPRTSATFAKRQKERARQEKQQAKQQRKLQRRLEKREFSPGSESGELGSNAQVVPHSQPLSDTTMAVAETALNERKSSEETLCG
jgi:hypothetical protein